MPRKVTAPVKGVRKVKERKARRTKTPPCPFCDGNSKLNRGASYGFVPCMATNMRKALVTRLDQQLVERLEDLTIHSELTLAHLDGIGPASIKEIKRVLDLYGLKLADE